MSTLKNETYNNLVRYIEENQNRFYLLAYSYVKNRDTALDIVQEAVYKGLTSVDSLKETSYIKTWFYRILVNTSLDELRRGNRCMPTDPLDFAENDWHHGDKSETLSPAEIMDLYQALDNLDPKSKTVIALRYFEDMKLSDIADVLAESIGSVKSRLYRSLDKLKIQLEGDVFSYEQKQ